MESHSKPLKDEYFHLGEMHCILSDAKDALKRAGATGCESIRTLCVRQLACNVIDSLVEDVDSLMHGGETLTAEEKIDRQLAEIWNEIDDLAKTKAGEAPESVVRCLEDARRAIDLAQTRLADAEREASRA